MKNSIMFALASATAFACLAVAPASAETFAPRAQRVTYGDLNLDHQRGAQIMLGRLESAAEIACGARGGPMPVAEHFATRDCVVAKIERGVADVNHANLTALYYGRRPSITIAGR